MAKEFAFDQVRRQSRAVHFDQGPGVTGAPLMNGPGDKFLAHTGFTEQQDGRVGGGDLLRPEEDGLEDVTLADDPVDVVLSLDLFAQIDVFRLELLLERLDLQKRLLERLVGLLAA